MVTYEAMTSQCGRSVDQVLVVRVDIGVVTYDAVTSVVQVLSEMEHSSMAFKFALSRTFLTVFSAVLSKIYL